MHNIILNEFLNVYKYKKVYPISGISTESIRNKQISYIRRLKIKSMSLLKASNHST